MIYKWAVHGIHSLRISISTRNKVWRVSWTVTMKITGCIVTFDNRHTDDCSHMWSVDWSLMNQYQGHMQPIDVHFNALSIRVWMTSGCSARTGLVEHITINNSKCMFISCVMIGQRTIVRRAAQQTMTNDQTKLDASFPSVCSSHYMSLSISLAWVLTIINLKKLSRVI